MASGDTKTENYLDIAAHGTRSNLPKDNCCNTKTQSYILDVAERIMDVEDEVEELKNNPDVVDIVDTYADLEAYDTQHLTDNDIIRVLNDETHNGESTYYRFTKNPDTWTYIGSTGPHGGGGPTVVQSAGTSQTDVMSQDAATKLIYPDYANNTNKKIVLGEGYTGAAGFCVNGQEDAGSTRSIVIGAATYNATVGGNGPAGYSISIGAWSAVGMGKNSIAIGYKSYAYNDVYGGDGNNVAIGAESVVNGYNNSVSLGSYASVSRTGEVNVGAGTSGLGFNSTDYRVIGGVHDGQGLHDAATVAQGNTLATSAPTTSTVGVLGQLYTDTTNMHTYQLTAIDATDPSNPSYSWTQRW